MALWNGQDKILKERLYGVTNHEGKERKKRERSLEGFTFFCFVCLVLTIASLSFVFVTFSRQPWRGRQGALLLSGQHSNALVHEGELASVLSVICWRIVIGRGLGRKNK